MRCGSLFSSRNVNLRNERWHLAKVAPVLPTTSRRHTKGVYAKLYAFLMRDLCGVEWSAFGPGLINTRKYTAVGQSRARFEVYTAVWMRKSSWIWRHAYFELATNVSMVLAASVLRLPWTNGRSLPIRSVTHQNTWNFGLIVHCTWRRRHIRYRERTLHRHRNCKGCSHFTEIICTLHRRNS
jgi:hypothetical protein